MQFLNNYELIQRIVNKINWDVLYLITGEMLERHLKVTFDFEQFLMRDRLPLKHTGKPAFSTMALNEIEQGIIRSNTLVDMNLVLSNFGEEKILAAIDGLVNKAESHDELNILEKKLFLLPPDKNKIESGKSHEGNRGALHPGHPENSLVPASTYEVKYFVSLAYVNAYQPVVETMYRKKWVEIIGSVGVEGNQSYHDLIIQLKRQVEMGKEWLRVDEKQLYDEGLVEYVLHRLLELDEEDLPPQ